MDDVVNSFIIIFVNIGPNLASQIPDQLSSEDWNDNLTSIDSNEIDMKVVKKVIEGISEPLTYICILSFQTGLFSNKHKKS